MNLKPLQARSDPGAEATASARRWEQIAIELRTDILAGHFAPGARLPNESLLAERFAVHRHTLRQAVRQLVLEGHLRVQHGSGTYVRELVLDYALQRRTRMTENLAQAGERGLRELLGHEIVRAGTEWASLLRVHANAHIELLHSRALVRGRPISLSRTVFVLPRLAGMAEAFRATGSFTAAMRSLGVSDYVRASSTVSCRLPTPQEADALARAATDPVLVVRYHSIDPQGVPLEAGVTLFAADAVQLTVEHA